MVQDEIREELEAKEVEKKVSGLKTLISLLLNGEVMPKLLMTVIRFCVPCDDHKIKKLLLVYWEVSSAPISTCCEAAWLQRGFRSTTPIPVP